MYEILFWIGILFVGGITSFTDIKYGKIRNKVLLIGILYAVAINLIIFFSLESLNPRAYLHYFTNSAFMLFLGFLLWIVGLWTAGDAKLFFVLNLLTPPSMITNYYLGLFYGFVFFINIFGVIFLFALYRIIRTVSKNELVYSLKKTLVPRNILMISLFIFSFSYIIQFFPDFFRQNFFIVVILFFILYSLFEMIFGKRLILFIVILSLARLIIDFRNIFSLGFLINFVLQILALLFLRFVLLRLSYFAFTKKVRIDDLRKGMFLAEDIFPVNFIEHDEERRKQYDIDDKSVLRYDKQMIENLTFISYLQNKDFRSFEYDKNLGLSEDNLMWFRNNKKNLLFKSIRIYETMPFAPIIMVGVIITLLIKGNIFTGLAGIIRNLFN
ncbi:MAG: hypothetical protein ACLFPQ_05710 [Candidatus Woesearchaeota archaeon]